MWLDYLFDTRNAAVVGGWGFIVGVISFLIGVVGFGATIWQIRKVKTATIASTEAVERLKLAFAQFDIIQECARAENHLDAIKEAIFDTKKDLTLGLVEAFGASLVKLSDGSPQLSSETHERIRRAISEVDALASSLGRKVVRQDERLAKQARTIRAYNGLLVKIRAEVQQEQKV